MRESILHNLHRLLGYYQHNPEKKFQKKALENGIRIIESIESFENVQVFEKKVQERGLKGIGKGILDRMKEIESTSTLQEFQEYISKEEKNKIMKEFLSITGVGEKRAEEWYQQGYRTIEDIRRVVEEKRLEVTHHILVGLKYESDLKERIPREEMDKLKKKIQKIIYGIDRNLIFEICGSYRRGQSSSGDIDIIVSNPSFIKNIQTQDYLKKIIQNGIASGFLIDHLTEKGDKKYMGICRCNKKGKARRIDIRVFDYENYWAGILYFTGNREFNIRVRNRAIEKGYSLNEYGLKRMDTKETILLRTEDEIFHLLEIAYRSPTERNE
jgi:DNA polymerase/3'-5' exonuclease PolX